MNKIIGLGAQLHNGKDACADYIVKKLGYKKLALAYNVKKTFCDTFGVDRTFVEKWKRINETPEGFDQPVRQSLIFIGDGFRKIRRSIWEDKLKEEIQKGNEIGYVVSDVRYITECKMIRALGGINVLIWRPGHENDIQNDSEQQLTPYRDYYIKEGYDGRVPFRDGMITCDGVIQDLFNYFIINNGTLEDFYKKIDTIINKE